MNKIHEKSPCCREKIWRLNERRRQCAKCQKTWRVWKRKRGRRRIRTSPDLAHRFVFHRLLPVRASLPGLSAGRNKRQYRLAQSRRRCFSACSWQPAPRNGKLIVIADALVKFAEKKWHTWYFTLVRPIDSIWAVVLPPYHRLGTETVLGWRKAFDALGADILTRIEALVCDGHRGLVSESRWRNWKLQRCHFHLIARLQGRRSKWKSSRHYEEGWRIYTLAKQVLKEPREEKLWPILNELEEIGWTSDSPEIRKTISGFVNHWREYRAYLKYPELKLPTTNNTAESLIGLVEEVCRRARGFKNLKVLNEWIICVSKTRPFIKCNGKNLPN